MFTKFLKQTITFNVDISSIEIVYPIIIVKEIYFIWKVRHIASL